MPADPATMLRRLPKVGDLLEGKLAQSLLTEAPRWAVLAALREEIDLLRHRISADPTVTEVTIDEQRLRAGVTARVRPTLERVVNATGVVLHTNLGRAPLAEHAIARVVEVARGYSNLEYRVDERRRGSRHDHAAGLLRELTLAESGVVVNNCAAAVLLALASLARGKKVVVSRGELVEIGGGFRVPDVMEQSGATLLEVGTTNRTRIEDYARALDEHPDVAMLMKVHRSNFAIVGFTEDASVEQLAALAKARGLPLFVDLGAGAMEPTTRLGLPEGAGPEPTVPDLIRHGADLVAFSGDKLLGGPQAGILVGKHALLDRITHNPIMRALRPDKLTLAALEGTLQLHRAGRTADIPALAMLSATEPALEAKAKALAARLSAVGEGGRAEAVRVRSAVGGGALPLVEPWSWAVSVEVEDHGATALEAALRGARPPVIGRISDGRVLLDVRTMRDEDNEAVERAFAAAVGELWGGG